MVNVTKHEMLKYFMVQVQYSFTLYPSYSRISIKNLVSRHSILRFSLEFERIDCVLSDGTQRRALPQQQSDEIKIFNISFPWVGIEATICRAYCHTLTPLSHNWPQNYVQNTSIYRKKGLFCQLLKTNKMMSLKSLTVGILCFRKLKLFLTLFLCEES